MNGVLWTLAALLVLAVAGAFLFFWNYLPFRNWVKRNLDPTWRRRAAHKRFPPARVAAEAADMFVSSTVMRDGCDIVWEKYDPAPPENLAGPHPEGTVIWVNTKHVPRFIEEFLPRMTTPFVLVSSRENNPTRFFDLDRVLGDANVLHWFMENYEFPASYLETGKVTPLPLGMNFHYLDPTDPDHRGGMGTAASPGQQQAQMKLIRDGIAPIAERPLKVYCNFQLNMDTFLRHHHAQPKAQARTEAFAYLRDKPFTLIEPRQTTRNDVFRRYGEVAFEASPRGNSIDCHRTWEALLMKTIPIVKRCEMDPIYDGLPVALIDDWEEVTETRLAAWVEEFAPWFDAPLPDRLYSNHWINRFHAWKPAEARPQRPVGGVMPEA